MKHFTLILTLLVSLCVPFHGIGQWCVPTSLIPYDADMPGITRVVLNTIDRTSSDLEHYPNNNYTNTGLTTTLMKGATYPITIDFTIDPLICPDMNLRVWVDLNHDGQLDDTGETLLLANHQYPSSYSGTITIPSNAMTGTTRMRITAKMSNLGGHLTPTPCDDPADPLGYHGEMEDYDVNIVDAVGIDEVAPVLSAITVFPDPASELASLSYTLEHASPVRIDVMDATGREVLNVLDVAEQGAGEHTVRIPLGSELLHPGVNLIRLQADGTVLVRVLVVE